MNAHQLDLFGWDGLGTPDNPRNDLEAAFWRFHAANPHIYLAFDAFSRRHAQRTDKYSATRVYEEVRWEAQKGDVSFRLSNNHRPYYARLWMRLNPQFAGFYKTSAVR